MLTREEILARKRGEQIFDLPDGSGSVKIRGLTRDEAMRIREAPELTDKDNLMISMALVEPEMSPEDVAAWGANDDAGTLTLLSEAIAVLSGLSEGAGKSGVSRPRKRR